MLLTFFSSQLHALLTAFAILTPAAYPGGEEALNAYIGQNLVYPQMPKEMGIEGVVPVEFTVRADGSIGTIRITRMIDPDLEQEAIRLVKNMPAWTPASDNGTPVESTATVKISFSLEEE